MSPNARETARTPPTLHVPGSTSSSARNLFIINSLWSMNSKNGIHPYWKKITGPNYESTSLFNPLTFIGSIRFVINGQRNNYIKTKIHISEKKKKEKTGIGIYIASWAHFAYQTSISNSQWNFTKKHSTENLVKLKWPKT